MHQDRPACPICERPHPFEDREVKLKWWPRVPRCLVIGENPGPPGAAYFYDPTPLRRDPVVVRRLLLAGLARAGLVAANTLEAFAAAGFAFDHAIRCQLETARIKLERRLARTFRSQLAPRADHLPELVAEFSTVWVMGHVARDAACHQESLRAHDLVRR